MLRLRPRHDADWRLVPRPRLGQPERPGGGRGRPQRQKVAGGERCAADAGAAVKREASELRLHGEPAGDGDIGIDAVPRRAEQDRFAGFGNRRGERRDTAAADRKFRSGRGHERRAALDQKGAAGQYRLDGRGGWSVAHQRIGSREGLAVHRAGGRDAVSLQTEAAAILQARARPAAHDA